jgi:hypothetical protein
MKKFIHTLVKLELRLFILKDIRSFGRLSIVFPFLLFGVSACDKAETEISSETRMAAMFFSRSSIGDVKTFREKNYIHGLSFFHFNSSAEDVGRVVAWLRMKEKSKIPPLLVDRVRAASVGTDWMFKWANSKIYVTYYCHPFDGTYWSVDMLFVNNGAAVFVTEGFLPPESFVTDDASTCETQTK